MLSKNQPKRYDPKRKVRLQAVRALFVNGQRVEEGTVFEVCADEAGDILATSRAKFADEADRGLVYKIMEV